MNPDDKVVAVTGHRPPKLGGYSEKISHNLFSLAMYWVGMNQPKSVITGMALGWDQAIAEACVKLNVPFLAAIPYADFGGRWPYESQKKFHRLTDKAAEVVIVEPNYRGPQTFQKRNEWMVDHCEYLLALWDGSPSGTKNCIDYANKKNIQVENHWDMWLKLKDLWVK